MSTIAADPISRLGIDPVILNTITQAVDSCLAMCGTSARCVGVSAVPTADTGNITGLIGVHGTVSGFVTVNIVEKVAMSVVGGWLQDRFEKLDGQVIDGVGEMTNIIAGGIKQGLTGTAWAFSNVTVPSVIVGRNYQIAYTKGLHYASAVFEHEDADAILLDDRLIKVALSLIRL